MKHGKSWGQTEPVLVTPLVEVHRLFINPNYRCSRHRHLRKWNVFIVLEGTLTVKVDKNDYQLTDTTVLGPGDITTVKPGEFHLFESGDEAVRAFEIYYLEPLSGDDIERKDCGGPIAAAAAAAAAGAVRRAARRDPGRLRPRR